MKRMIASAGLLALGAAGVQAEPVNSPYIPSEKSWNITATLRGFYDSNPTTSHTDEDPSWGMQFSPALAYAYSEGPTDFGVRYRWDMNYYANRPDHNMDNSQLFDAWFLHAFSERMSVDVSDQFVYSSEPEVLASGATAFPLRTEQNNIRNVGGVNFNMQLTPRFGITLGYLNTYYNYEQNGGNAFNPSLSGLLDRIEQIGLLNLRWQGQPSTVWILGYNLGHVGYTGDEGIGIVFDPFPAQVFSDSRNTLSQYGYVGVDHTFRPDLTGSIRAGARYTDYVNDSASDPKVTPYVNLSLRYNYLNGSYVAIGGSYDLNSTDVVAATGDSITQDQQTGLLYAQISHQFTPKLTGTVLGQFQSSTYYGGAYDGDADTFYLVGLNLSYQFNHYLSGNIGYNYDFLNSDIPGRGYDRNRAYFGVTASY